MATQDVFKKFEEEQTTEEKPTSIAKRINQPILVQDNGAFRDLLDTGRFQQLQRVSGLFAASKLVPEHFQRDPASVFVVLQMALRQDVDPFMMLQNTYTIKGKPGMQAQLAIALVNKRGPFRGPIQWRMEGDPGSMQRMATAYATHDKTGEKCEAECSMQLAKAEGWIDKNGSKWRTMPDMMLRYRSATFLARLYCPEVLMGLSTLDELQDIGGDDGATVVTMESEESDVPDSIINKPGPEKTVEVVDNTETGRPTGRIEISEEELDALVKIAKDAGVCENKREFWSFARLVTKDEDLGTGKNQHGLSEEQSSQVSSAIVSKTGEQTTIGGEV